MISSMKYIFKTFLMKHLIDVIQMLSLICSTIVKQNDMKGLQSENLYLNVMGRKTTILKKCIYSN